VLITYILVPYRPRPAVRRSFSYNFTSIKLTILMHGTVVVVGNTGSAVLRTCTKFPACQPIFTDILIHPSTLVRFRCGPQLVSASLRVYYLLVCPEFNLPPLYSSRLASLSQRAALSRIHGLTYPSCSHCLSAESGAQCATFCSLRPFTF
jgi:hypothetical protein